MGACAATARSLFPASQTRSTLSLAVHLIEGLLANKSDIQPSTVHADTQGQSAPVFALATLFGFDLMPRIRNFKDLIFFRPGEHLIYPHTDALFGERGRNVIDWKLIERHWQDLMQVAISISEGRLSSATLMRRLRSNSRKNRIYKVFREVGRSVRTVALLRYLADPQLRARITAATNKVESYNGFSHWLAFGNNGVLAAGGQRCPLGAVKRAVEGSGVSTPGPGLRSLAGAQARAPDQPPQDGGGDDAEAEVAADQDEVEVGDPAAGLVAEKGHEVALRSPRHGARA